MKRYAALLALSLLAACASTGQEERINAVKDFIEVSELPKTDVIRTFDRRLEQEVLNDRYVIVSTRREQYLLEYAYTCREDPFTNQMKPDVRRDARAIYAGADTFRGCQIKTIYVITKDQAEEIKNIGEAPGE